MELQAGREALLELLAQYRSRSHHRITVVFDGWQHGDLKESRDRHQGMLIIYSRRGERADEVIKRLLHQERERALVVTSDQGNSGVRRTCEGFLDQCRTIRSVLSPPNRRP